MKLIINENEIVQLIHHQIENFWGEIGKRQLNGDLRIEISKILQRVEKCFSKVHTKGIWENGESVFSPFHTTSWTIFLYYLSNELLKRDKNAADMIYYLNKVLHSVDWYHEIMLPDYFFAEHPLCSVLGRAKYSNYLLIYQGTTIGGSSKNGTIFYPVLGENVILYAGSSILGNCHIGSNVILSANTCVKNEDIPSDSIVYGESPNLIIKRNKDAINKLNQIWK